VGDPLTREIFRCRERVTDKLGMQGDNDFVTVWPSALKNGETD
jgi:hypothetical protein